MSVSVIIPAWNAAGTLAATIKSALAQPDVAEIIVVDDGSTDNTAEVARAFGTRVRVESIPNGGVSNARNLGFRDCSGDWVQFLDSDDQLLPGTIASRLRKAASGDVIITDWLEFLSDEELDFPGLQRRIANWELLQANGAEIACAVGFWAPPAAVLYRRSIVERIGGFRVGLRIAEDARHLFDAARLGARFVHLPEIGAAYRVQPNSLSRRCHLSFLRYVQLNGRQVRDIWRADGLLSREQRQALAEIFSAVASGLFNAKDPVWRDAYKDSLEFGWSWRLMVYSALERMFGLAVSVRLLSWVRTLRGWRR